MRKKEESEVQQYINALIAKNLISSFKIADTFRSLICLSTTLLSVEIGKVKVLSEV